MSRRFAERVQAERAALRCINEQFPDKKLHGLSPRAIAVWDQSVDWTSSRCDRKQVLDRLFQIGGTCQALADQSRGTFDAATFDALKVREEIAVLRRVIAGVGQLHHADR